MSRSHTRPLVTLSLAIALAVGLATPATAHNFIVSSTPADDEALTMLPDQWQVTTNEALLDLGGQGAGFALIIRDEQGQFYGDGCVVVRDTSLVMPAALGASGPYTMTYQFVSADGHTLSGELPFSWQAPADFERHVGLAVPPVSGETASAPEPERTEIAQPGPNPEATSVAQTEAVEPTSDVMSSIIAVVIFMVLIAIAGVVTAAVLRARARPSGEQRSRPEDTDL